MSKILVVVDMQNDFIDGALGTPEAQAILPRVIDIVRGFSGEVIFTRDTHPENYLRTREGLALPVSHCIKDTAGWQIQSELEKLRLTHGYAVIDKPTFASKELGEYLLSLNASEPIEQILLVGLCTDICVISNAMLIRAFLPEVKILVDSSATAGVSPESHSRALASMSTCQIEII